MIRKKIDLPYGNRHIPLDLPGDGYTVDILFPGGTAIPKEDTGTLIDSALSSPVGCDDPFKKVNKDTRVAITINDKTRPVPNSLILLPLLDKLRGCGVPNTNITLFIASGTHTPMLAEEYPQILDKEIYRDFKVYPHDCDDNDNLYAIGKTIRNTPVFVNRRFFENDVKIVLGDIELHHFAGFSGGVKSAAIGMCGRKTINTNHKLLLDPRSILGQYEDNPLRSDIEEIGRMIKVDLALNAVLNENKEIVSVFFGDPVAIMSEGIKVVRKISQVRIDEPYDLVIASAGGYPKDINLYQSQKAMTHGSFFCRPSGLLVLVAECSEGAGSQRYLDFMNGVTSIEEVIQKFAVNEFSVGPHKAFQIARILEKHKVYLISSISDDVVKSLLLEPLHNNIDMDKFIQKHIPPHGRIAVLPYATACIPAK